tara:strand:+ start:59838 stop:60077 length:240 start_codon:yes stop_codon:yes gene_type:complete
MDTSKKNLKEDPHADKNKEPKKKKSFPEAEENASRGTEHAEATNKEKAGKEKKKPKKDSGNDLEDYKNNNLTQREPDWQ